jgi:hypothetical protein
MKARILNALLVFTSFFGYLEWSGDSKSFLFQAEAEILSKAFKDPASVIHPFIVLPFLGQLLLILTLFQKNPGRVLTYAGIGGIGLLMLLILLVGILAMNYKIFLSTLPFLILGIVAIRHQRKRMVVS